MKSMRFILSVSLLIIFTFLYGIILIIVHQHPEFHTELKPMTFTVEYVNLVQYSNRDDLTGYVYLVSPNGKRHKISSMNLYQKVKNHIGQKVELEIEVTYFYDEDGKRIDKKEQFSKPIKVLNIYGEEQVYEESIKNIEVHRHTTVVPIPFYN